MYNLYASQGITYKMEPMKMENYSQEMEQNLLLVGHNIKDLQNWSLASQSSDSQVPYFDYDASRYIGFDHTFQVARSPNFFTQPCTRKKYSFF